MMNADALSFNNQKMILVEDFLAHFLVNLRHIGPEWPLKMATVSKVSNCTAVCWNTYGWHMLSVLFCDPQAGSWAGNLMLKHVSPWFSSDVFVVLTAVGAQLNIGKLRKQPPCSTVLLHSELFWYCVLYANF